MKKKQTSKKRNVTPNLVRIHRLAELNATHHEMLRGILLEFLARIELLEERAAAIWARQKGKKR